uniref:mechanosensitive ion channel domain-containing protein n=1 Tax=Kamptonema formosum TaxID=331992 RepID=UPI001930DD9C
QQLGFDLSGLLVTIGGAAFVLGFALKDILANFFSGLVLLIDTPFSFGDVVALSDGSRAVIKKNWSAGNNIELMNSPSKI